MPSISEKQRKFFGIVRAFQKGDIDSSKVSASVRKAAHNITAKDASDFASSVVELKTKKAMVSILKDIVEPMYLQENEGDNQPIDATASTFNVKENWAKYIKLYIGQPFSTKDIEALTNFKEKKATTINRTEIWYKTTDSFSISKTTVIKKMKDSGQFSFTAFQKQEKPETEEDKAAKQNISNISPMGVSSQANLQANQKNDEDKENIIVTKSILFKDDIKGASILVEFLKKLDL